MFGARAALALAALLPGCANCAADCEESFTLTVRGGRMTAERYDFVVVFDDREHRGSCTFADTATCSSNTPALLLSIDGSSFVIKTMATPAHVRVDITWATGSTRIELDPSYSEYEKCGSECRSAAETRSVTSW